MITLNHINSHEQKPHGHFIRYTEKGLWKNIAFLHGKIPGESKDI